MIDERIINNWFTYHPPVGDQTTIYETIRAHAREFAHILNNLVPDSADKTDALRKLRECVMTANAAVAMAPAEKGWVAASVVPPVAPARRADAPAQTATWPRVTGAVVGGIGGAGVSAPVPPATPNVTVRPASGRSMDEMVAEFMSGRK